MAFRIWQYKMAGSQLLSLKGEKAKCERLARDLASYLFQLDGYARVLRGIIELDGTVTDADEHEVMTIGRSNELRGLDTLEADRAAVLAELPTLLDFTTEDGQNEIQAFRRNVREFFLAHVHIRDEREKREDHDAAIAEGNRIDAERKAKYDAEHAGDVDIASGRIVVLLALCVDRSDPMSDYSNRHSQVWSKAVYADRMQAETQALAREAIRDIPELKAVTFDWHTEKHSMGHGNYLEQNGGQWPEIEERGEKVRAHYEVVFTRGGQKFTPHPNYRDALAGGASAAIGAPVDGALARVSRNEQHNGVEIKFRAKPDPDTLEELKANGFRWSFKQALWYTHYTEEKYAWALERFAAPETQAAQA